MDEDVHLGEQGESHLGSVDSLQRRHCRAFKALVPLAHDAYKQVFLAANVVVQGSRTEPRLVGEFPNAGPRVALPGEQAQGRKVDALLGGGVAGSGGHGAHTAMSVREMRSIDRY